MSPLLFQLKHSLSLSLNSPNGSFSQVGISKQDSTEMEVEMEKGNSKIDNQSSWGR